MAGGVRGHANGNLPGTQQGRTALLHPADEVDQVLGVPQGPGRRLGAVLGEVAAQGEDATHPDVQQVADDRSEFLGGVAHAGQVGQWPQRSFDQEPVDELEGGVPVRSAGAVGDGDVVGLSSLQLADCGPEGLRRRGCYAWNEVVREQRSGPHGGTHTLRSGGSLTRYRGNLSKTLGGPAGRGQVGTELRRSFTGCFLRQQNNVRPWAPYHGRSGAVASPPSRYSSRSRPLFRSRSACRALSCNWSS